MSLWWRRERFASWKGHPLDLLWWKNPRRFRTNIFLGTRNCISVTDDFQRRCWWFHESVWMRGSEAIGLSLGKERNEENNKNEKAHSTLNFSWKKVYFNPLQTEYINIDCLRISIFGRDQIDFSLSILINEIMNSKFNRKINDLPKDKIQWKKILKFFFSENFFIELKGLIIRVNFNFAQDEIKQEEDSYSTYKHHWKETLKFLFSLRLFDEKKSWLRNSRNSFEKFLNCDIIIEKNQHIDLLSL